MAGATALDVVVLGGANSDYMVRGPILPKPGETVPGDLFDAAPGGKGANQALAAARLGARVAFIGRVGADDRGRAIVDRLSAAGVDVSHVVRDEDAPTGVALVQVNESGEKQMLTLRGANWRVTPADVQAAAQMIQAARFLLAQLEVPLEAVAQALIVARDAGVGTILDPAPPVGLPNEILRHVDVIRPNASEAGMLTGMRVSDRASARDAGMQLLRRGAGAAVVDTGGEGNLLVTASEEVLFPLMPVNTIDQTGAGDAFAAALAVELASGRSLPEAGRFASAAAALATTRFGAQAGLPHRDEVIRLLG